MPFMSVIIHNVIMLSVVVWIVVAPFGTPQFSKLIDKLISGWLLLNGGSLKLDVGPAAAATRACTINLFTAVINIAVVM